MFPKKRGTTRALEEDNFFELEKETTIEDLDCDQQGGGGP